MRALRRLPLPPGLRRGARARSTIAEVSSSAAPSFVHPSAVLEPGATIGAGVHIGPYCVIGGNVELGDGVRLDSHVRVAGHTVVGAETVVHSFATLGALPQDLKYAGEPSHLVVGAGCRIAEYALLSGGTAAGGGVTALGDGCFVMSHCHVAHDCVLGEGVLLASSAALAGHVHVGDGARISGYSCVQQKVCVGRGAFLGGGSVLDHDLIPYGLAVGNRAQLHSVNVRGLRRQGSSPAELRALLSAYRYLFGLAGEGFYPPLPLPQRATLRERAAQVDLPDLPRVMNLVAFILGDRAVRSTATKDAAATQALRNAALCMPVAR